jgi:hypothetical protein
MPVTNVNSPYGIIPVNHPEGATQEEIVAYAKANHKPKEKQKGIYDLLNGDVSSMEMIDGIIDPLREFAGGASYQFADEAEAKVREWVDKIPTEADRIADSMGLANEKKYLSYGDFKAEIDAEREEYQRVNPGAAMAAEIAGGITGPGALLGKFAVGSTALQTGVRAASIGGVEGAVYGMGAGKTTEERIKNALTYGALSSMTGGVIGAGLHKSAQAISNRIKNAGSSPLDSPLIRDMMEPEDLAEEARTRFTAAVIDLRRSGAQPSDIHPLKILKQIGDDLDIDVNQIYKIRKADKSGVKGSNYFDDIMEASESELLKLDKGRHMHKADARKVGEFEGWVRGALQPIFNTTRDIVGDSAAGLTKRSQLMANVKVHDYTEGTWKRMLDSGLVEHAEKNMKFRGQLLDMANGNANAAKEVRSYVNHTFGRDVARIFEDFMETNKAYGMEYAKRISQKYDLTPDWLHTQKAVDFDPNARAATAAPTIAKRVKDTSALARTRGMAEDLEVNPAEYMNPLTTMHDWVVQHAPIMEFSKYWGLRPATVMPEMTQTTANAIDPTRARAIRKKAMARLKKGQSRATVNSWVKTELNKLSTKTAKREADLATSTDYIIKNAIPERMRKEGYAPQHIEAMQDIAESLFVHGQKSANRVVRAGQNIGFSSTLGNPYAAAMNLHDVFNTAAIRGFRNTVRGFANRNRLTVDDVALTRQTVGEYTALMRQSKKGSKLDKFVDATEKMTELSMRYGAFEGTDAFGKNVILNTVVEEAKRNWPMAAKKWGRLFSESEMTQLQRELSSGKVGKMTKQMALMGLGEQQLINITGRPRFWLNHPNARIMYMLTGFAIKQGNLLYERVLREALRGNTKEAAKFLAKYTAISGGGYAVVQEGRQPLKGAEADFSPENMAYNVGQQMFAVASLNRLGGEYNNQKFLQDPGAYLLESLVPPLGLTGGVMKDMAQVLNGDVVPDDTLEQLPVVGKTLFKPMFDFINEES